MALVRVWTDVGSRKPVPLLAKIEEQDGVIYTIRYLSEGSDGIWRYEEDTYDIDDESIAERLKTSNEEEAGFRVKEDGFVKETDDDYVPESEDETEDDDEEDEETEEDEEEFEEDTEDEDEEENIDDE
jgi:hypothetical protein